MMYIHRCVTPAVVLLVATFFGIKTCGPVHAQSTGNILTTASIALLLSSPLRMGGLPDEASDTAPSSDPQPLPTEEAIRSFLMTSIGWNCTPSILGMICREQTGLKKSVIFKQINFNWRKDLKKYSCSNRCGVDERNALDNPKGVSDPLRCFCDKFCDEYGDCCFDFNKLCRKRVNPRGNSLSQHEICRPVVNQHGPKYVGFAVRNTCPKNWTDEIVRHKCQNEDQSDLLNDWPVFDPHRRLTYRNVFCARCNGAVNTTYWRLEADCSDWFDTTAFNLSELMRFAHAKCSVKIRESWVQYLKQCIPRFQECSGIAIGREKNGSYCQSQCLGYAFPVCFIINKIVRFRNLQCALCNGFKPSYLKIDCFYQTGPLPPPPPLTILFDFTTSFETRVTVIDEKRDLERIINHVCYCAANEVYDPYVGKCRSILSLHPPQSDPTISQSEKTRKLLNLNCTFVAFNQSDYEQRPNAG
ncbi:uncharacterized protein [Montipora capricornis]|uniref:uncharacterized protein n=1 Tax=Montipora capricornis TaxID=246305 RepID=UPI0035F1ADB1